jgi:hypothetical protein
MLFITAAAVVTLFVVDAVAFDGRHRQDGWRAAQTQANLFNYSVSRLMRMAGNN